MKNGPEGEKLMTQRPEKRNEIIGSLESFVFCLYFSESKIQSIITHAFILFASRKKHSAN